MPNIVTGKKKWLVKTGILLLLSLVLVFNSIIAFGAQASIKGDDNHQFASTETGTSGIADPSVQDDDIIELENSTEETVSEEAKNASVQTTLAQLQAKFPAGKYWNHAGNPGSSNSVNNQNGYTSTPCPKHGTVGTSSQTCNGYQPGSAQLSWQCMGYAEKLGYDATGIDPRGQWVKKTSSSALDTLKAGDIVRYKNDGHSIFVTGVNGSTVMYTDCNSDGHCKIRWGVSIAKSTLKSSFSYVRVCPVNLSQGSTTSLTKDSSYPTPAQSYPAATSGKITVYDLNCNPYSQSDHYIAWNDLCTIDAFYKEGYCRVTYPSGNGQFTALAKTSSFIPSGVTPYSWTPSANLTSYTRSNLSETFGSVFTTDKCTVVGKTGSNVYQLIYPITGGYKLGWINTAATPQPIPQSDLPIPILGYNASASARTTVYQYVSTLGGTSWGEIFVDDLCTINSVNFASNCINVTYPISGGTKTGYVYINQFFPDTNSASHKYSAKVSKNTDVYRKSDMKTTIGTVYSTDTFFVVGKNGDKRQILYPVTEGTNKGKYKLGWISSSNIVKNLKSIAVTSNPSKTTYLEGESLNTSGLVVTAYYDDGSTANVTGSCSFTGYSSSPGSKTVNVSYSGKTAAFTVIVNEKVPNSITINQLPAKTIYYPNENFDKSGLKVTAQFNNNTSADVTSEVTVDVEDDFSTPGTKNVLLSYYKGGKTVTATFTVKVIGQEMSSGYDRVLPDGDYMIVSAADPAYYLDIPGGDVPAQNGSNVQIYGPLTWNMGAHDAWTITYSDGFYSICQKNSNAALDVKDGSAELSGNVQIWQKNSNSCQKWAITYFDGGKGYRIQAKCSGMSLDIAGANIASGTNVQQYSGNSSNAQRWLFIPYEPQKTVDDGRYVLVSALNPNIELDVAGDTGNVSDGTNVQIWNDRAPSRFNSFDVQYEGNGYYHLVHAASGKYLDVNGSNTDNYGNIDISSFNEANNQKWCIIPQNGGFMLVNRNSGLVMDVQDGKTEDGTNVRQHYYNGSNAQTWIFKKAEHTVRYDANGGTGAPAAQTKYYANALTLSEENPEFGNRIFKGWSTDKNATTAEYQPGSLYSADEDLMLYAVWYVPSPDLVLPTSLKDIEEEAFSGGAFAYVYISDGVETIGARAFAECRNLHYIRIPDSAGSIAADAFEGVSGMVIFGKEGSYAEFYAGKYGFDFVTIE